MHIDQPILERVGIAAIIFFSMFVGMRLFTKTQRHRLRKKKVSPRDSGMPTGYPRLLYFWTEECAPCRAQEREINQAKKHLELSGVHLTVDKFNAHSEKLSTERFNIMTVPTTVLLDSNGVVVGWNPGLTRASRLIDQVTKSLAGEAKQRAA